MPIQASTDYLAAHVAAFEGQKADLSLINIISKVAQTGDIPFGRAVVRGTLDDQAILPTATGQLLLGITQYTTGGVENGSDLHLYEQYKQMNIIDFGEVWVYTEDACVPGDAVYFRHTADTAPLDIVGRFRTDASGGDADIITGATFETTTAAGGIARIKLNAPGTGVLISPDSSETLTAAGAASILTGVTYFDSTAAAMAVTLADGTEGQIKTLTMLVDGGNVTVTPANYANGTTIVFNDAFDSCTLRFTGTQWHLQAAVGTIGKGIDVGIETITATTAVIGVDTDTTLVDTTLGAMAASLADGVAGQIKKIVMTVDGGDCVITPTNLAVGATLRLTQVNQSYTLQFIGTNWTVIAREGLAIQTITDATTAAMALDVDLFIFDTTVGASTGAIAAGYAGQIVEMKMLTDGGDQVITPATFLDGTTLTFDGADGATIISDGTNWLLIGTPTATLA